MLCFFAFRNLLLHSFQVLNAADHQRQPQTTLATQSRRLTRAISPPTEVAESTMAGSTARRTQNSNGAVPPAGQGRPGQPDVDGNVTIKGTACDNLVQKGKDLTTATKQLSVIKKSRDASDKQLEQMTKSLETCNEKADLDKKTIEAKDKVIEELKAKIADLTQSLRKTGKVADCELNESLKEKTFEAAKLHAWRTQQSSPKATKI